MRTIIYTDAQIVRMTSDEVSKLGLLCPKRIYFQMETSGSPSAWTDNGEQFAGTKGADIVRCAMDIKSMHEKCVEHNWAHGWPVNGWNYSAHIRCEF